MKNIFKKVILVLLPIFFIGISHAGQTCDNKNYSAYFIDVKKAIDAAKKHPHVDKSCAETSESDTKIISDEVTDFFKGIIKGAIFITKKST